MRGRDDIHTRYSPPDAPLRAIPREVLYQVFDDAAKKRVACVTAPAGYGKTVSTALWLERSRGGGHDAVWISLSPYDDVPSVFYRRILSALRDIYPENRMLSDALESAFFGASPVERSIEALLSLPRSPKEPSQHSVLVLDDIHLIGADEIIRSLPFVLNAFPNGVTTLLLGRGGSLALHLTEALKKLKKKCAEIGPNLLRFSEDEVTLCFESHGREILPDEAKSIWTATEGWPIAVMLEAAFDEGGKTGFIRAKKETNLVSGIERYIKTTLWDTCDDGTKNFLIATCVADEMTPAICSRLTGIAEAASGETLEAIARGFAGLVRRSGDEGNILYAHHHLFLDFLRRLGTASGLEGYYALASDYYLERNDYYAALNCAVRSGQNDNILSAVWKIMNDAFTTSCSVTENADKLRQVVSIVSVSKYDELPCLYLLKIWHASLIGSAGEMCEALDRLYEKMPEIAEKYPNIEYLAIMMRMLDHRLPPGGIIQGVVPDELPVMLSKSWKGFAPRTKNLPFVHKGIRDFSGYPGLPEDPASFRREMAYWPDSFDCMENVMRAGMWYEKNDLPSALSSAAAAESLFPEDMSRQGELKFCASMIQVAIMDAMERAEDAVRRRNELRTHLRESGSLFLLPNLMAYEAKIRMTNGEERAASDWLENYFVDTGEGRPLELYKIFQHLTTARALMVCRGAEEARPFLRRTIKLASDFARVTDAAEALVLLSILEWHRGNRGDAAVILKTAVMSVRKYRYIRLFADEGAAVLPVIKNLLERERLKDQPDSGIDPRYLNEIRLAAYARSRKRAGISVALISKRIKLTTQQNLVLRYLSRGYGRAAIAEEMGVAATTVKFHTNQLYERLDAHSAEEAVFKARELGIL
ncbi:MAG: LuxR C-terminal-related transcriptional regulator [Synergistaceae bacterium]|jgi:LuxR family maltose regulon positive regulatory protein|nr:LuxR C-terminal-related transcriptional regulator [Synergistaceae bacterium]